MSTPTRGAMSGRERVLAAMRGQPVDYVPCAPYVNTLTAVHQAGRVSAYTMYSGIMPILDYLSGLEFDCISALDIAFDEPDLGLIAGTLHRMSFWTGPSNTFHMYAGPDVVRKAVRDVFTAFRKNGLIISAASSVHPMMPWENTLAMLEEWRRLR